MINKIIKNLKPIDYDLNIKYTCPNCGCDHWVAEKAASYHKFVIVCDCDTILKPRTIQKTKFLYKRHKVKQPIISKQQEQTTTEELPLDKVNKCAKILEGYGFSQAESESLLQLAYKETNSTDCATLIKFALFKLGDKK